ncbi:hypothetical protein M5K25_019743 [Dendrobium thyrsiflorum]|uniref:Uncharacterized protein n=1 Tax=Dendrobium thyrsiflorum TaxID=117978 RepID=A0ABD0UG84_DENTH
MTQSGSKYLGVVPKKISGLCPQQENVIGKMPIEGGEFIDRRMDFESLDYPGSGANGRHDPRSPGKP